MANYEFQGGYWDCLAESKKAPYERVQSLMRSAEEDEENPVAYSLVDQTIKQWGDQMRSTSKLKPCYWWLPLFQPDVASIIQESGADDLSAQVHPRVRGLFFTAGNLAILPDKHGPEVGSTAFSGRPSGRGQCSPDACGDGLHTPGHDSDIFLTTAFGSRPRGKQRFQDGGGDYHLIQVDPPGHDSATFGSIAVSNSASVVADWKPYKNLVIFLNKYGPDVGSTAFGSKTSCGEQNSPGGGDEDHIIEGNDSAATAGSPEQTLPELNNTPSASDQSVSPLALLENRDDGDQPLSDRSASNMGPGVNPPAGPGVNSPAERRLNPSSVAKVCLLFSCVVSIAPSEIRYNAGNSLSSNANILYLFAEALGVVGFLLCFGAYICQQRRSASVVMTVMGGVATTCGLLSILGTRFPEKSMLWCTAALCALPISALPFVVRELIRSIGEPNG